MARRAPPGSAAALIARVEPISVNHVGFAVAALGLIILAWSRYRAQFLPAFVVFSAGILATWLTLIDALALLVFLAPPYIVARYFWGKGDARSVPILTAVVLVELSLFVLLRRYPLLDGFHWIQHSIAIVGLSYMLFRAVHLVAEGPYLGAVPLTPLRYVGYMIGLWTLFAGPIQRYDDFSRGVDTVERPKPSEALAAAHRVVNGLLQAFVIAPFFSPLADLKSVAGGVASPLDFVIAFYAFPIYLYLNFSGYTNVMIGIARLCGVTTLPENFDRPYLARNVQDFWRRWHMSFGAWIRQYVFTPLSVLLTRRAGPRSQGWVLALAVLLTFVVVGAWHGVTANFLVFGLLHGIGVIVVALWARLVEGLAGRKAAKRILGHPAVHVTAIVLCQHYVYFSMLFFNNDAGVVLDALAAISPLVGR